MRRALLCALVLWGGVARADDHWYDRFTLGGWVDIYWAYDTNRPPSGDNFISGEGTTAKKHNQFSLNLAAIELLATDPVIVHLVLNLGTATDVLHNAEPRGDYLGPDAWRYIQQAYLGYKIPVGHGLTVEAGIFPSHVGYETFNSKDNWNYTRSWMAENSPYYQAGLRVSYPFTERLSAQLLLLNGWGVVGEDNGWKTLGAQIVYARPRFSLALNTIMGAEQPGRSEWRFFFDGIATVNAARWLQLAATVDWGFEQRPAEALAHFWGAAAYARFAPRPWLGLALRGEVYHDGLGASVARTLTGVVQTLEEGTLTLEFRLKERLFVKVEGRYDHSDQPVFDGNRRSPLTGQPVGEHNQGLVVVGCVATF
jgi:hypothetical protein